MKNTNKNTLARTGRFVTVNLRDGRTLNGKVVNVTNRYVDFNTSRGGQVRFAKSSIVS